MSTSRGILLRPMTRPFGNVGDVALAEERQQVMLAETVEVDVAHDHHLAIIDAEQRAVQHFVDVGVVSAREKLQRLLDPLGRPHQPFARRIFAELDQQARDQILHLRYCISRASARRVRGAVARGAGRSGRALSRSRVARERAARRGDLGAAPRGQPQGLRVGVEAGARALLARHQRPARSANARRRSKPASRRRGRRSPSTATSPRATSGSPPTWARSPSRSACARASSIAGRFATSWRRCCKLDPGVPAGLRRSRARPLVLQGAGPVRRRQEEVRSSTCARRSPTTRRASSRVSSSPRR